MLKKITLSVALVMAPYSLFAESLQGAVQHALISNPEVLMNTAKSLSTKEDMAQAKGAYYPSVDVTAGIGKENTESPTTQAIDGVNDINLTRQEAAIELNQNIFAGGAIVGEFERRREIWIAQRFKTLGVAEDLALDVTEKYLEVLKNQRLVRLARDNVREHKRISRMITDRSLAGVSREAENEQAKGRLALSEANLETVKSRLREAKINYIRLVGDAPNKLRAPRVPGRRELPRSLAAAIQKGLDNHPTLKSAYADILEAKAQHKVAKSTYFPRLDAVLSASRNRNLDGLAGINNDNLAILRLRYNVFNGGSDLARQRSTAYQVQEAYEIKNRSILQVEEALRLAWNAWVTSKQRLTHLKSYVTSSRKTRAAYAEQFKVGKRSLLDLLDSQNEFYSSRIEYDTGRYDEMLSRYRILNGMGYLVAYLNGRMPVTVINTDASTSHENIHHNKWIAAKMLDSHPDKVPAALDHRPAVEVKHTPNRVNHYPVANHQVKQTTTHIKDVHVKSAYWYVQAGAFGVRSHAAKLANRLKAKGMKASYVQHNGLNVVILGPYEHRGHALLGLKKLHEKAHINGFISYKRVNSPKVYR